MSMPKTETKHAADEPVPLIAKSVFTDAVCKTMLAPLVTDVKPYAEKAGYEVKFNRSQDLNARSELGDSKSQWHSGCWRCSALFGHGDIVIECILTRPDAPKAPGWVCWSCTGRGQFIDVSVGMFLLCAHGAVCSCDTALCTVVFP